MPGCLVVARMPFEEAIMHKRKAEASVGESGALSKKEKKEAKLGALLVCSTKAQGPKGLRSIINCFKALHFSQFLMQCAEVWWCL
jgi:hypothetical protein